jgi:hypothetical protein
MRNAESADETVVWTVAVAPHTRFSWWREHGQHFAQIDPSGDREWRISLWLNSTCILEGSRCLLQVDRSEGGRRRLAASDVAPQVRPPVSSVG